jgi:geranylgeranyl pyrophosphate synthase
MSAPHLSMLGPGSIEKLLTPYRYSKELEGLLGDYLIDPINVFFQKPGKNIRPKLVRLGFRLAHGLEQEISPEDEKRLLIASEIVEMIHGGSLIIDDIQDGSEVRRNEPCLHLKQGMPLALNAGNWLYFHALSSIRKLDLGPTAFAEVLDDVLDLMGKAHLGQALDLGVKIDQIEQSRVRSTCMASMELKTGTVLSLALRLGMEIAGSCEHKKRILELGRSLGLALQIFDDLGNFNAPRTDYPSKRHEDLYNRRPTWIWAVASSLQEERYDEFCRAVASLPEEEHLIAWIEENSFLELLRREGEDFLTKIQINWSAEWGESHPEGISILNDLKIILETSYVKKN